MARGHWLVKSEPGSYSWERFVEDGGTRWDGVRNPTARANLGAMKKGDDVLFYHSGEGKAVVGLARVTREAYPDPTSADPQWLTCDFTPLQTLPRPVNLAELKADPRLATLALLRQPRLAVMTVRPDQFKIIAEEMSQ